MHRDVKPHNVMIDHEKRQVRSAFFASPFISWTDRLNKTSTVTLDRLGVG